MTEDRKNRTRIARRNDWKTKPMPEQHETFVLDRSFSGAEMDALRRGNVPQAMEDKWFWYMEGSTLWAHRSWTGHCIYRIDFQEDGHHIVTVNRDPEQYGCTSIEEDLQSLNKLLDWWAETPYDHYHEWLSETYDMLYHIRWIFFDLGSTLIDETAADRRRIREMIEGTEVTEEMFCEKRLEMIRQGLSGDSAMIAFFGLTKTPWHSEDEKPYPDAEPTLAALRQRGFRLGVIANQNPGTEKRLTDWGLRPYFDMVAASSELGVAKPDPEIFRWALKQADCSPQNAVMVGDRMDNDIAPANRLGMHTVRLLRGLGAFHEPQSPDEQPEHTIYELAELLAITE